MMRIHFKDPKLTDGLIKVSLDGGYTFNEHNISDVKADGILLDESQDFDKIIVKGPANVLKNLDVLSKIQIDGDSIGNTGSSAEPVQKNTPIYVFSPELNHRYVTNEAEETSMEDTVDDGNRVTSLIINYEYLANLFNITDGRTIYFDTFHPDLPGYERQSNYRTYFYAINPEEIKYLSFDYNNNYKNGLYLYIRYWSQFPEPEDNFDSTVLVKTFNGEVASPSVLLPTETLPQVDNVKDDSLSQKTDFTVSDTGNNPPWDLVTSIQPNLETIIVQDGITEIPENFFYKEGGLTVDKIVLPTTITDIQSKAFKGCTTTIEYAGSPNMWNNEILFSDDWDEDADINITYLMVDTITEVMPNM